MESGILGRPKNLEILEVLKNVHRNSRNCKQWIRLLK